TQIASSAVINSDYFTNQEIGYVNPNLLYEFTYDNSHKLKEIILSADNEQQVVSYNYDIAGEVRISSAEGQEYETTVRGILNSNGTVKTIKWQGGYSDGQTTSNLAYNAEGYLSDYDDNNYPYYEGCNAYRYQWNGGNLAAVTHKNCTTQVYVDYLGLEYSDKLNDKTNLDLNVLCFDICSKFIDGEPRMYEYPSMFFALSGNTGKRSKNYLLKVNGNLQTPEYPNPDPLKPYTEATAPAIGSVLATYYDRVFDGNAVWQFDGQDFPTKFSRTVKVTKTQVILDSYERENATPHDDYQREEWIQRYGEGPWFFIINRQYHENNTVKNDIYTWAISYNK
ncbi:MAG: hypothetical protein LBN27_04840, partial [Prevotellaceae bacterium]|nr:hypothetical protein [Prevotellaceae bacterium]